MSHKNPDGFWRHEGGYSIELIPGTLTHVVPDKPGVTIEGDVIVRVAAGTGCGVANQLGIVEFYFGGDKVGRFPMNRILRVRKADGSLIWQNYSVKD